MTAVPEPGIHGGIGYGPQWERLALLLVQDRLGGEPFRNARGLALIHRDRLVGGLAFHGWTAWGCELAAAADHAGWCRPGVIRAIARFVRDGLGRRRVTARTSADNTRMRRLLEGIGFVHEGTHPHDFDGRRDLVSYGMTEGTCRWLRRP